MPGEAQGAPATSHHTGRPTADARKSSSAAGGQRAPDPAPASPGNVTGRPQRPARRNPSQAAPQRPSLGGGIPAKQRGLGTQGRQTMQRLLQAGLAVFAEMGLQATRVEDIVRRAQTSHGTFYLYFANKDDLFRTLLQDALEDVSVVTGEFPVVTSNEAGRAALRRWVDQFSDVYAVHATLFQILSQAELVGDELYADGLQLLFQLAEAMTQGMTAARKAAELTPAPHAELTAVACLMMLERVNYLLCAEVKMPRDEMNDRLAAIIYAAFQLS
jgi:AcrR family transcriptional regulator